MTKEDILKRQIDLIIELIKKRSVARTWFDNWVIQQRIDAVLQNIEEIKNAKVGEKITVISFIKS